MLITPRTLTRIWGVAPRGVLHVGAHQAEEDSLYRLAGWGSVTWVEAMPDAANALAERFAHDPSRHVIQALAWSDSGERMTFHVADNGMSSSVFEFGTHSVHHPEVHFSAFIELESVRLDAVLPRPTTWDLINIDVQGAELQVLKGLGDLIDDARWVYSEVNEEPVYEGCALIPEMDDWLAARGLVRVDTAMTPFGWGDALYARPDVVPGLGTARRSLRRMLGRVPSGALGRHRGRWLRP